MRTVLITGTSSGFGLLATVELARRDWRVFATMRNLERKGPLEVALDTAGVQDRVVISRLDVTQPASVCEAVAAMLLATGGRLDAVVHNAGVAAGGAFEDIPDADVRRVLETNFFGVLDLTRALLPTFRTQRSGRILIVSSEAAFVGQPANSIYCASKWAIEGWAEAICHELAPFGIVVLLVEPGPYVTGIWQNSPRISPEGSAYRRGCSTCSAPARRICKSAEATRKSSRCRSPTFSRRSGPRSATPSAASPGSPIFCAASCRARFCAAASRATSGSTGCSHRDFLLNELPGSRNPREIPCEDYPPPGKFFMAAVPAAMAEDDCKNAVVAEGKPALLRDLGAYPNSLFAWRSAKDAKVDCTQNNDKQWSASGTHGRARTCCTRCSTAQRLR